MSAEPSPRSGTPVVHPTEHNPPSTSHRPSAAAGAGALPIRSIAELEPLDTSSPGPPNPPFGNPPSSSTKPTTATTFIPAWRRETVDLDGTRPIARRQSVQFVAGAKGPGSRSSSLKPPTQRKPYGGAPSLRPGPGGRRLSSPPPPPLFRPSVSFDTFSNPAASDFSLTLNRKHRDYAYTKRSRTFLCGTDTNEYSDTALEWLIDELVDDGDEVVCLRVVEKDSKEAAKWSGGQGEKGYRREAQRFLEEIEKKNTDDRAISLVLEFSIGKVNDTIQQMIRIYEPAMLVVGTRGRSLTGYQGLLSSGSVSKYCLQYSPVPVIVVRPSSKREAKKRKRLQDPSRSGYRDILDKSEDAPRGRGGHLLDANNRLTTLLGSDLGALGTLSSVAGGDPDDEARRVAEAIGYRASFDQFHSNNNHNNTHTSHASTARGSSLSRLASARSDHSTTEDLQSPSGRLLKSPELGAGGGGGGGGVIDSPTGSDDLDEIEALAEDDEDEDEESHHTHPAFVFRPEDEAAMLAYERAQKIVEEEREEAVARARREAERSASRHRPGGGAAGGGAARASSRGRQTNDDADAGGGGGATILDIYEKLNRGIKN